MREGQCPLCGAGAAQFHEVTGVHYFECAPCDFIFADRELLDRIDAGEPMRAYDEAYWRMELPAARERSFGAALVRVAETLLYARGDVIRFLDIGTGPGYLLDAVATYLPQRAMMFYGIEAFPPPEQFRSRHPHYIAGELASLYGRVFQAGTCIEVIEHMTPAMVSTLGRDLARISDEDSIYLFNTGLTDFVRREEIGYLDPFRRGHICAWSVTAAAKVLGPHGFAVQAIPGKPWAFVAEYKPSSPNGDIRDRIWTPQIYNKEILHDPVMGSVLYIAALDAARAY
jgi:hypothetical protein